MFVLFVHQPLFNFPENFFPCFLQALLPVPRVVTSIWGMIHAIEQGEVCCFLFAGHYT